MQNHDLLETVRCAMSTATPSPAMPCLSDAPLVPYTLRIGVTGHRKLDQTGSLIQKVSSVLLELRPSMVEATVSGSHHPLTVGRNRWHRLEDLLVCQCKRFFAEAMILPSAGG